MNISIENYDGEEPGLLADVIARAGRWSNPEGVTIICRPRTAKGWCEYLLAISGPGQILIGCIQRERGAVTEFHS